MTGEELWIIISEQFAGVQPWPKLPQGSKDGYTKIAAKLTPIGDNKALDNTPLPNLLHALLALPDKERQQVYRLLYNSGCRINR